MNPDDIMWAWHRSAVELSPPDLAVWDAHTHTGIHDPDGVVGDAAALIDGLDQAGHRGAVVMSNANPAGYKEANDRILEEAATYSGRLIPFCRVNPNDGSAAVSEAERCLDAGAKGIKMHPRAEAFSMADPGVRMVAELAADRAVPILIHAGRGIMPLGADSVALLESVEGLRLILAHCAISDLSHLGPVAGSVPGLYFDTSWWDITDRLALHAWVPPHRILYASDTPYGWPALSFAITQRAARASGYGAEQLVGLFGTSLEALLEGNEPESLGPAAGSHRILADPGLIRVHASIHGSLVALFGRADIGEPLSLALLACDVAPEASHEPVYRAIAATLRAVDISEGDYRTNLALLILAAAAALTPEVAVPDLS